MGLRVRPKAKVPIGGFPRQASIVLQALKRYGMMVADNGSNWYISGAPKRHWNNWGPPLAAADHGGRLRGRRHGRAETLRFDAVVAGGGSAGCVLAARLSENPERSVCLLEAGPDYGPDGADRWPADILDGTVLAFSHSWERDDPEDRSQLRARILGGCSAHNACAVLPGAPSDYDEWGRPAPTDRRRFCSGAESAPRRASRSART